jgi:hypothetical protein
LSEVLDPSHRPDPLDPRVPDERIPAYPGYAIELGLRPSPIIEPRYSAEGNAAISPHARGELVVVELGFEARDAVDAPLPIDHLMEKLRRVLAIKAWAVRGWGSSRPSRPTRLIRLIRLRRLGAHHVLAWGVVQAPLSHAAARPYHIDLHINPDLTSGFN